MKYSVISLILILGITKISALSILVIQPIISTSHHVWTSTIVKGLLQRGHHVHFASIHEFKVEDNLAQNYTNQIFSVMRNFKIDESYNPAEWRSYNLFYMIYFTHQLSILSCEELSIDQTSKELVELVKTKKFDIIMPDVSMSQCLYGIWELAKGKPPIVGFIPFGNAPWIKDFIGGSNYPALRPYVHMSVGSSMTLWDRTMNFVCYMLDDLLRHYYVMPKNQILANNLAGKKLRPLWEYEKSIRLVMINTHHSFEPAIPLPPNAIEIAGIHAQIAQPIKDVKIRKFLDDAKDGVIVISMGTNVAWKHMDRDKVQIIASVLSKLKQRVVWKLEDYVGLKLSDNILPLKWISQNDILTHKNVKAVWTHVGLLSTHEAIWHGIPIIGMPFFMDQKSNIKMLMEKGVAVCLDFDKISADTVEHAVQEIIYNPKYWENMKKLSLEFRDRPLSPLDLAVWYVEYVARHPEKDFGYTDRSSSQMEQNLYDVYILLFVIFIIFILTCWFLFAYLRKIYFYLKTFIGSSKKQKQY